MRTLPVLLVLAASFLLIPFAEAAGKGRKAAPAKAAKGGGAPNVKLKPVEDQPEAAAAPASGPVSSRGPTRIDFDDRLIQGQTNKSGAIYIFERKNSEIHSMVRRRTSFREEILRSIE